MVKNELAVNQLRAVPFKKLVGGMSYLDFSDHPPTESQNFGGYLPVTSHYFRDYPPAESTKRS